MRPSISGLAERRICRGNRGIRVTENFDNNTNEVQTAADASQHQQFVPSKTAIDFDDDDSSDMGIGSGDAGSADDELTPNDIFGLDPLDVLTLEELAEYLKISPAAVRRVMKEQNLPGRNLGGEWRFLRDAVANWLRGQEAPAQAQQKARVDYSKPPAKPAADDSDERSSRPPKRSFAADESGGGEFRPRSKFSDNSQQYGNQGGGQYGNRGNQSGGGGGQYGNRSGQYGGGGQSGGGQSGSVQYGGGQTGGGEGQYRSGNYGSGGGSGGSGGYSPPPRRPFRSGGSEGGYGGGGAEGGGAGGYTAGGGAQFSGGGYAAGGQQFSGGPKRKNKRQVFDNERGKRLDRRKEDGTLREGLASA